MRERFRQLLNLPEMTPEQEMELLGNIASVPFQGGELMAKKIGEYAGMPNATGEDLIRAASDKLGADRLLKQETLDSIAQTGGGILEGALDPTNLATMGVGGLLKAGGKGLAKMVGRGATAEAAKAIPGMKNKANPIQDKGGVKVLDSSPMSIDMTPEGMKPRVEQTPKGAPVGNYAMQQKRIANQEREMKELQRRLGDIDSNKKTQDAAASAMASRQAMLDSLNEIGTAIPLKERKKFVPDGF